MRAFLEGKGFFTRKEINLDFVPCENFPLEDEARVKDTLNLA